MLVLLSPAKSLDFAKPVPANAPTKPRFEDEATMIARAAAELRPTQLEAIMDISPALAQLNAERFGGFAGLPTRAAAYAFAGDVYAGLDARSLDAAAIGYAQDHVRILSGLYGLLRPLDAIRPYRLEMGTKWAPGAGDLYSWWGTRIAAAVVEDARAAGAAPVIVNLASREYYGAVAGKLPGDVREIEIEFREMGPNGPRWVSFSGKKARGLMARWIVDTRIDDAEALKGFGLDGYAYDAEASDDARWRFIRG